MEQNSFFFCLIIQGTAYFESLLETLQEAHKFNLETYLEPQPYPLLSGLGYIGLAIISCQKILIFLGDLARYREMTSETSNYGKAKRCVFFWRPKNSSWILLMDFNCDVLFSQLVHEGKFIKSKERPTLQPAGHFGTLRGKSIASRMGHWKMGIQ